MNGCPCFHSSLLSKIISLHHSWLVQHSLSVLPNLAIFRQIGDFEGLAGGTIFWLGAKKGLAIFRAEIWLHGDFWQGYYGSLAFLSKSKVWPEFFNICNGFKIHLSFMRVSLKHPSALS